MFTQVNGFNLNKTARKSNKLTKQVHRIILPLSHLNEDNTVEMTVIQRQMLGWMGITIWRQRDASTVESSGNECDIARWSWPELEQQVRDCQACGLCESRTQTVFGVGSRQADLLIVGEAPGAEEDKRGEPFVGRAGQLLNAMLTSIGLTREQVFIANTLKCRPPRNRDPQADELQACAPFLQRQIALLKPRVLLALGRIAAQHLLSSDQSLGKLRGQLHTRTDLGVPIWVSYHPAYLLRAPHEKRKAYTDLLAVQRLLKLG